jgi:hypothetical protein
LPAEQFASALPPSEWDLLSVGTFEDDVAMVKQAKTLPNPPRSICAVAAGVREFGDLVDDPADTFGIAQWFPGSSQQPALGPGEADFLSAYSKQAEATPDYPAVQAIAGAVLAEHCVRQANTADPGALWSLATTLDTDTLFGGFRVDSSTGVQLKHQTALVRWTAHRPELYA